MTVDIPKEILSELYGKHEFSESECAEFFGVSKSTIHKRLKEYKIKRRTNIESKNVRKKREEWVKQQGVKKVDKEKEILLVFNQVIVGANKIYYDFISLSDLKGMYAKLGVLGSAEVLGVPPIDVSNWLSGHVSYFKFTGKARRKKVSKWKLRRDENKYLRMRMFARKHE